VLQKEGVAFHLQVGITETKDLGKTCEVKYTDTEGETFREQVETLLVAMGRKPKLERQSIYTLAYRLPENEFRLRYRQPKYLIIHLPHSALPKTFSEVLYT
jgi:pyruvate/2-oxoglutarate dehydrogenase complex dihydrolipoamide dehydrogenase (E3) component